MEEKKQIWKAERKRKVTSEKQKGKLGPQLEIKN
jgi:hypothetical protein